MNTPMDTPLPGPIEAVTAGRKTRSLVALAAAIAGSALMIVGFFTWILAALNGTGEGTGIGQVMFFVGLALDIIAIGIAIWSIIRGAPKLLPVMAIAVAFAPVLFLLGLQSR